MLAKKWLAVQNYVVLPSKNKIYFSSFHFFFFSDLFPIFLYVFIHFRNKYKMKHFGKAVDKKVKTERVSSWNDAQFCARVWARKFKCPPLSTHQNSLSKRRYQAIKSQKNNFRVTSQDVAPMLFCWLSNSFYRLESLKIISN